MQVVACSVCVSEVNYHSTICDLHNIDCLSISVSRKAEAVEIEAMLYILFRCVFFILFQRIVYIIVYENSINFLQDHRSAVRASFLVILSLELDSISFQ